MSEKSWSAETATYIRGIFAPVLSVAPIILIVLFLGCDQERDADVQTTPPSTSTQISAPEDLNIVLITIDTLRTDRLSCYGSDRVETPFIDGFAVSF